MTTALRPLSTGELLDRTFSLYRSHFGLFVGLFAIPQLLVLAFQLVQVAVVNPLTQLSNVFSPILWGLGSWFLMLTMASLSEAATAVAVSQVHLGRPAGIAESFSRVKGHFLGLIVITVIVWVGVVCGLVAIIVPGVLLAIIWSLSVPAKVLENKSIFAAMSRSVDLTKGDWGRIFVIGLLVFVLTYGVKWLLQWPILIAAAAGGKVGMQFVKGWQVASVVAVFVSESLVGAVGAIAFSLVYYDERVRKEAFDLQLMMTTLDASSASASPAQVGA
jgi:hypothetical protein